jgi:hypothetical protein
MLECLRKDADDSLGLEDQIAILAMLEYLIHLENLECLIG